MMLSNHPLIVLSLIIVSQAARPPRLQSGSATQATDKTNCNRCKSWIAKKEVYSCSEFGRVTAVGDPVLHCLEHYATYMQMSAYDRSACIEKAK